MYTEKFLVKIISHIYRQTSGTSTQVTNYGLGGLCETHIDPKGLMEVQKVEPSQRYLYVTGDIVATFMAWLSDTKAGGGTVYLYPGYEGLIMPEKGSAAFWYDLYSDGMRDRHSRHAGCPVLMGSKWILNKWMHMYDNFQKFPCKLKQKSRFSLPNKNGYF